MLNLFKKRQKLIVYDLKSIPEMWTIESIFKHYNENGIIFWDSSNRGVEPKVPPGFKGRVINLKK